MRVTAGWSHWHQRLGAGGWLRQTSGVSLAEPEDFLWIKAMISGAGTRGTPYTLLRTVCALVIGVYAWGAKSGWLEPTELSVENTCYNLLVRGFRSGQLNLEKEVPPGLAQLTDTYDPMANDAYQLQGNRPGSSPFPAGAIQYSRFTIHSLLCTGNV